MSLYREILEARRHASGGGLYCVLDELGTYTDRSGNANDQSAVAAPTRRQGLLTTALPTSLGGGAIPDRHVGALFAVGQYVEFPTASVSLAAGQAVTFACWAKRHTTGTGAQFFWGRATSGNALGGVWYANATDLIWHTTNGTNTDSYAILRSYFAVGTLLHIAATVGTDDALRLYVNGTLRTFEYQIAPAYTPELALSSKVLTNRNNTGNIRAGEGVGGSAPTVALHGVLAVQKQLSADQVRSLYLAGLADVPRRRASLRR